MLTEKFTAASAYRLFVAVIVMSVFSVSCKKEQDSQQSVPDLFQSEAGSLKQAIRARGFHDSSIVDKGDRYVVEGDIVFYKADSAKYIQKANAAAHQRQTFLVDYYLRPVFTGSANWEQRVVYYYIDNSVSVSGVDSWTNAIYSATQEWNDVPSCGVLFSRAVTLAEADIVITSGVLDNLTIAEASAVTSAGQPGPTITINLNYFNNKTVPESQKTYNMVHELGHCLGFFHTNQPSAGTLIPGTPSIDANSVMNGGTAENQWAGFSVGDITASQILYPLPFKEAITEIIGNLGAPETGFAPISWNASLFPGSTVKVELFTSINMGGKYNYALTRVIASAAANTGSLAEAIDFSQDINNETLVIKVTSNANPDKFAFSNKFRMRHD